MIARKWLDCESSHEVFLLANLRRINKKCRLQNFNQLSEDEQHDA